MKEQFYNKLQTFWRKIIFSKGGKSLTGSAAFDRTNVRGVAGKYSIAVFTDLQGAFDAVWRKGALYKSHKGGITNSFLSVFSRFLTDTLYRKKLK